MTTSSEDTINAFKKAGVQASYFYADDTTKEWDLAADAKAKALALFDAHPELQPQMRAVARDFLWSLRMARPEEDVV